MLALAEIEPRASSTLLPLAAKASPMSVTWPCGRENGIKAFTGREWDPETNLYYYRARYYDPKIGRFISEDPIGFAGGKGSLYTYVGSDPANFADPEGLVKFRNVPPDKKADIEAALDLLRKRLSESCCGGDKNGKLLKKANDPNLEIEYKPNVKKWCGRAPFKSMLGLKNKLQLSPVAWNCCFDRSLGGLQSLASVILHELRHQGQVFPSEKGPREVEKSCFGCTID
jgi:RHS repeat-associated protein